MPEFWPELTDYDEALQAPATRFRDPDLRTASAEMGPLGPKPLSGNFATVYHLTAANGRRSWAVRCFNRRQAGREARSQLISHHLNQARLQHTVGFEYQHEGIQIRGEWFPIVKMDWVEGETLDLFVGRHIALPKYLGLLFDLWCKVEPILRSKSIAHGDLQHGNVMLVPGKTERKLALKLIDYDGLWIKALAHQPSEEVGHSAYQHPERSPRTIYSGDIDRFPHLVIAASLKCLSRPGLSRLWKTYHQAGEHLLLQQTDFQTPGDSAFLHDLWDTKDVELRAWAGLVAIAARSPLAATPRLSERLVNGQLPPLSTQEDSQAREILEIAKLRGSRPEKGEDDRQQQHASLVAHTVERASGLHDACQFSEAVTVLQKIPAALVTEEISFQLGQSALMAELRDKAIAALKLDDEKKSIRSIKVYRDALVQEGLVDVEFAALDKALLNRLKDNRQSEKLQKSLQNAIVKFWIPAVAAMVALIVIVIAGSFLIQSGLQAARSGMQASNLAEALQQRKWDNALSLDENCFTALVGRAEARLHGAQPDLAGALADLDRAAASQFTDIDRMALERMVSNLDREITREKKAEKVPLNQAESLAGRVNELERIYQKDRHGYEGDVKRAKWQLKKAERDQLLANAEGHRTRAVQFEQERNQLQTRTQELSQAEGRTALLNSLKAQAHAMRDMPGDKPIKLSDPDPAVESQPPTTKAAKTAPASNPPERWNNNSQTLQGHSDFVRSVAFSPDGQMLASGSFDKSVRLWDVASGKELRKLQGHTRYVQAVAFAPDRKTLASASYDKCIKLWDVNSGEVIQTLQGHTGYVQSVAFAPDGQTLASGSSDKTVKLWNVSTGRELRTLSAHKDDVNSVAFALDGQTLASGSYDNTVICWDVNTGKELRTLQGHSSDVNSLAYAPDGQTLASGSDDKTIHLWNLETGQRRLKLTGHGSVIISVAFSPDGQTLASGSKDKTIKLWDVTSGKEVRTLDGHTNGVSSVAFSPDGRLLASASLDRTIKLWDLGPDSAPKPQPTPAVVTADVPSKPIASDPWSENRLTLRGYRSRIRTVAFSPDSQMLASGSDDGHLILWRVKTGEPLKELDNFASKLAFTSDSKVLAGATADIPLDGDRAVKWLDLTTWRILRNRTTRGAFEDYALALAPDGKRLACSTKEGKIALLFGDELQTQTLLGHMSYKPIFSLAFSPDGQTLASGGEDRTVHLWDVTTGQGLRMPGDLANTIKSLSFSSDGKSLASICAGGFIYIWDTTQRKELRTLTGGHSGTINSVAFAPDNQTLASCGSDKTIVLWNLTTGVKVRTLHGHASEVYFVAFSPDGQTLASASADHTIKLWGPGPVSEPTPMPAPAATATTAPAQERIPPERWDENRLTLRGHTKSVNSVAFTPDHKTLASASSDATIKLWSIATGRTLQTIKAHTAAVQTVSIASDGQTLASTGQDHALIVRKLPTGAVMRKMVHGSGFVACLAPDSQTLASDHNGDISLWDVSRGQRLRTLGGHAAVTRAVAFSPDGTLMASVGNDNWVKLWDLKTAQSLWSIKGHKSSVNSVAFSPDGRTIASGSGDGSIKLWNVSDGALLRTLPTGADCVAFAPDHHTLASASGSELTLWDVTTGETLRTLPRSFQRLTSVAFTLDGRSLASAGEDGTIELWGPGPVDVTEETPQPAAPKAKGSAKKSPVIRPDF